MVSAGDVLDDGMSYRGNRVSIARAGGGGNANLTCQGSGWHRGLVMPPNEVDFVGGKRVQGDPRGPGGPPHGLCVSGDGASGVAPRQGMHGDAVTAISLGLIEGVVGFADEG